jgi:hypothetical protein
VLLISAALSAVMLLWETMTAASSVKFNQEVPVYVVSVIN